MKIKKVNELNENFEENILDGNDKVQELKSLIMVVYDDLMDSIDGEYRAISFDDYWNKNADKLIQKFNILDKEETQNNMKIIEIG